MCMPSWFGSVFGSSYGDKVAGRGSITAASACGLCSGMGNAQLSTTEPARVQKGKVHRVCPNKCIKVGTKLLLACLALPSLHRAADCVTEGCAMSSTAGVVEKLEQFVCRACCTGALRPLKCQRCICCVPGMHVLACSVHVGWSLRGVGGKRRRDGARTCHSARVLHWRPLPGSLVGLTDTWTLARYMCWFVLA